MVVNDSQFDRVELVPGKSDAAPASASTPLAIAEGSLAAAMEVQGSEGAMSLENGVQANGHNVLPSRLSKREREVAELVYELENSATMLPGQTWYVVSGKWWQSWMTYVGYRKLTKSEDAAPSSSTDVGVGDGDKCLAEEFAIETGLQRNEQDEDEEFLYASEPGEINNWPLVDPQQPSSDEEDMEESSDSTMSPPHDNSLTIGTGGDLIAAQSSPPSVSPFRSLVKLLHRPSSFRVLNKGLLTGEIEYKLLPEEAWKLLYGFYGGGPEIPRSVIVSGPSSTASHEARVELFPLVFQVKCAFPEQNQDDFVYVTKRGKRRRPLRLMLSRSDMLSDVQQTVVKESSSFLSTEEFPSHSDKRVCIRPSSDENWLSLESQGLMRRLDSLQLEGDGSEVPELLIEFRNEESQYLSDAIATRWRRELKIGDLVDARDQENKWYESRVVSLEEKEVEGEHLGGNSYQSMYSASGIEEKPQKAQKRTKTYVTVHFNGWASRWDTTMPLMDPRIAPLHTHVPEWRNFSVGKSVETRKENETVWYDALVQEVDLDAKQILVSFDGAKEWIAFDSERICPTGTHIKKPGRRKPQFQSAADSSLSSSATASSALSLVGSNSASGWSSRTHHVGKPAIEGAVGLQNLGNTCFMNSMLQCISNCRPITTYFLRGDFRAEINANNPLGMGGKLARAFSDLLREMWSGNYTVVVPSRFKSTIGQYAPQFAGYQQQDSQELMNFLLDGLHEDLNRVKQKPYTEGVESNGKSDQVVAEESWKQFLRRNQSVIVDHCMGQLRSHVTCPSCGYQSITFDPFMSLSLPLPIEQDITFYVTLHRLGHRVPTRYGLKARKMGNVSDLVQDLARICGVHPTRLSVVDVVSHRVSRWLQSSSILTDIRPRDDIHVFEIGTLNHLPSSSSSSSSLSLENSSSAQKRPLLLRENVIIELFSRIISPAGHSPRFGPSYNGTRTATSSYTGVRGSERAGNNVLPTASLDENNAIGKMNEENALEDDDDNDEQAQQRRRLLLQIRSSASSEGSTREREETATRPRSSSLSPADCDPLGYFGTPMVLSLPVSATGRDLHQQIFQRVSRVFRPGAVSMDALSASPTDTTSELPASTETESARVLPYKVYLHRHPGDRVEIPFTDEQIFPDLRKFRFSVELAWTPESVKETYDPAQEKRKIIDISAKTEKVNDDRESTALPSSSSKAFRSTYYGSNHGYGYGSEEPETAIPLSACLEKFTEKEQLGERDTWYCPKCSDHKRAFKKFDVWKLPRVLVLHLKRFQYAQGSFWVHRDKIDTLVEFPIDSLDMSKYVIGPQSRQRASGASGDVSAMAVDEEGSSSTSAPAFAAAQEQQDTNTKSNDSLMYDLFAVSEHSGGLGGGHYTAVAKNFHNQKWYSFNDSFVSETDPSRAVTPRAYVLFYIRREE